MRHTEFWARLEHALGKAYAGAWAEQVVLADIGGRTVRDALDAGVPPKEVWLAVWRHLELPVGDK